MVHTAIMLALCTGHVAVILEYILTIFLYHNAAAQGDVIPSHDGRLLAFVILLFLNVSVYSKNPPSLS